MRGAWMNRRVVGAWPWLVLAAFAGVAAWHALDFSEARDTEFPRVIRPHFNPWPPAAYRLAEPGDTLDRVGLYLAAVASGLAVAGLARRVIARSRGESVDLALWPSAAALALAAAWHSATPGPAFDGWHGLGWRAILDPATPLAARLALAAAASMVATAILINLWTGWGGWIERGRRSRLLGIAAFALIFVALRQVDWPGLEPSGFWPRCAYDLGMLAFALALLRARPIGGTPTLSARRGWLVAGSTAGLLIVGGVALAGYHRPLARLHAVVPGRIYISAMPTYRGLAVEQSRLHFKTIINLFDEASVQGSPGHLDEIRFVREHDLRYVGSPSDGLESDRFLEETLALAQDPAAWPILVHCHGCMDRSPAWMGLYRFLVEGRPLAEIYAEIERHRGSRPKAVVTLQYHRKLPKLAPDRLAADPTGRILGRLVNGTPDPFADPDWNHIPTVRRVVTRIEPETRRP